MDTMLEAEIWTISRLAEGNAVLLRPIGSEIAVPIFIRQSEARAILLGFREGVTPRRLTHDLLLDLAEKQGLNLIRVEIHSIKSNVFHSRLIFSGGFPGTSGLTALDGPEKKPFVLNSRPSDALALAVRRTCPILISQKVANQAGLPLEFFLDAVGGDLQVSADTRRDQVTRKQPDVSDFSIRWESLLLELDQAIAAEEYERAAEIRDVLGLMDKNDTDKQP
jgi:bifunctional DNase/RNase